MPQMFGTDGVRGVANKELTIEMAMKIGQAAGYVLGNAGEKAHPRFLIGMDTRISSRMLEAAITAGLCSVGADVLQVGVVPTPAVAWLVKNYGADAGVMISASHNSFEYNGIKLFSGTGFKLSDEIEDKIEAIIQKGIDPESLPVAGGVGSVTAEPNAVNDYINHIASSIDIKCDGIKVALDCANGSSSVTAEKLFSRLGCEIHLLHNIPNGTNINDKCGSTHTESLQEYVKANKMDLGLAFDGDADRCLAVDAEGNLVDGDKLIAIAAYDMKNRGVLAKDTAVVTVMSNMGFWRFAEKNGISVYKTAVGDRYVLEEMLKDGYNIGGEQSGHIIFLDYATTGDGQLTGVQLLANMRRQGKTLKRLAEVMEVFPQTLVNVIVSAEGKKRFADDKVISEKIKSVEEILGNDGRVLVRLSGTEPKIRVMLEGKDQQQIDVLANEIADLIKERLA